MRTMSISINETLYNKLKHSVPPKKISKFISDVVSKELEKEEQKLVLAYQTAEKDKNRQQLLIEWEAIDDFSKK